MSPNMQPQWKAEPCELQAKEGHDANRQALNGLLNETILAAEAAAAKVESESDFHEFTTNGP